MDSTTVSNKLSDLHLKFQKQIQLLEMVSGLQSFLQLLLELVIVGDRVLFLRDLGFKPTVERLFEEKVKLVDIFVCIICGFYYKCFTIVIYDCNVQFTIVMTVASTKNYEHS